MLGAHIIKQQVNGINGGHGMALPHEPGVGDAAQCIGQHVAHIGWHHIQGAAGMALRIFLKVIAR